MRTVHRERPESLFLWSKSRFLEISKVVTEQSLEVKAACHATTMPYFSLLSAEMTVLKGGIKDILVLSGNRLLEDP